MQNFQKFAEQVIQNSDRCIIFTDQDNLVSFVNSACLPWLGCDHPDELQGKRLEDLNIDPQLLSLVEQSHTALAGETDLFEKEISVGQDETAEFLTLRCMRVRDDDAQVAGLAYTFRFQKIPDDVAYDKIMIDNLMRNSPDLIYFKDLNSRFTRVNEALVERLGVVSVDDVIGKDDFDFWNAESASQFLKVEQEVIQTRQAIGSRTESGVLPDGEVAWSLMSKMPLIDERGEVVGTFGINKDITQQKNIELELEKTNKELVSASRQAGMAEIATNVLHNVGNVLNSINVSISQADETIRRLKINNLQKVASMITENAAVDQYLVSDEKGKRIPEYLGLIARELEKDQQEVVSELASTKRHLEHIKVVVSMQQEYATANRVIENLDLAEILEDAIRMSSGSLERHRIALVREFEVGMNVSIDKHRVLQILVNLIRNAKHAMQEVDRDDKQLTITVNRTESGMVSIAVNDNGIGIAPENLANLFNHGFTTKKSGHGFGLHSGANFARELGGSLIATSAGIGHGATFTLTLPVSSQTMKETASSNPVFPLDLLDGSFVDSNCTSQ